MANYLTTPADVRDRVFSRQLRKEWPNFARVKLERSRDHSIQSARDRKRQDWLMEMPCQWWCNQGGHVYYISSKQIAVMFKLAFGGAQIEDESK